MIIDGRTIRDEIKKELTTKVSELMSVPQLSLVYVGTHPVIDTFVGLKKQFGGDIGVEVNVVNLPKDIGTEDLKKKVEEVAQTSDGVVLQLPLPSYIQADEVVASIPTHKDPDMLSERSFALFVGGTSPIVPPVVSAIREIFSRHDIEVSGKQVAVVGRGKLVGKPVSLWILRQGVPVTILEKGDDLVEALPTADIIISGAGSPHLITPDLVKEGAVLIDAGTSDVSGETKGDIDPEAGEKASLFSPVPGGVGPITIAKLFENFLTLVEHNRSK